MRSHKVSYKDSDITGMRDMDKIKDGNIKGRDISDIRSMFRAADALLPIDEESKSSAIGKLRREIAVKEVLPMRSRTAIWLNRMRYADRSMIGFHALSGILMLVLIGAMDKWCVEDQTAIGYVMILSGVLGSISVMQVGRICFAKLAELSETCFFNVRQMAAFDLILSGIINLTVLSFGILFVGFQWKVKLVRIGLYMLVPFVFAQCICLGVMLTEAGRKNLWLTAAAAVFLSAVCAILAFTPEVYVPSALFVWGIALVAGGALYGIQLRMLFSKINKGEILCANLN